MDPLPVPPRVPDILVIPVPGVTVLVGAPGSGKTTLRHRAVAAGLDPALVVSLDDFRRELRQWALEAGREPRPLQAWSYASVLRAHNRQKALLANGSGYLVDSRTCAAGSGSRTSASPAPPGCPSSRCCCPTYRSTSCSGGTSSARRTSAYLPTSSRSTRTGARCSPPTLFGTRGLPRFTT